MRHDPADDFTLIEDLFIFHVRMQYSKALGYVRSWCNFQG